VIEKAVHIIGPWKRVDCCFTTAVREGSRERDRTPHSVENQGCQTIFVTWPNPVPKKAKL